MKSWWYGFSIIKSYLAQVYPDYQISASFSYTTHFNSSQPGSQNPHCCQEHYQLFASVTPIKCGVSSYPALPQLSYDSTCPNCSFLEKESQNKKFKKSKTPQSIPQYNNSHYKHSLDILTSPSRDLMQIRELSKTMAGLGHFKIKRTPQILRQVDGKKMISKQNNH